MHKGTRKYITFLVQSLFRNDQPVGQTVYGAVAAALSSFARESPKVRQSTFAVRRGFGRTKKNRLVHFSQSLRKSVLSLPFVAARSGGCSSARSGHGRSRQNRVLLWLQRQDGNAQQRNSNSLNLG